MTSLRLGLAGDWHGDLRWAHVALGALARAGAREVHHLGDFGIWPGAAGARYLDGMERRCAELGLTLHVTPGNHEDYDRIARLPRADRGGAIGRVAWLSEHVSVVPRGHSWVIPGDTPRRVVSVGGAASIDVASRVPGQSWWAEEAITDADVLAVEATAYADGVDVLLTHDAPTVSTPAVSALVRDNPMGWPEPALLYAAHSRRQVARIVAATRPRLHIHGHYHVADTGVVTLGEVLAGDGVEPPAGLSPDARCRVVALDQEGRAGNLALLDLTDLGVIHAFPPARRLLTSSNARPITRRVELPDSGAL